MIAGKGMWFWDRTSHSCQLKRVGCSSGMCGNDASKEACPGSAPYGYQFIAGQDTEKASDDTVCVRICDPGWYRKAPREACTQKRMACENDWFLFEPGDDSVKTKDDTVCNVPQWKPIFARGSSFSPGVELDQDAFNKAFHEQWEPFSGIARRECAQCPPGYRDIYFKQLTNAKEFDAWFFLLASYLPFDRDNTDSWNQWKDDNDKRPVFMDDFEIYSTLDDALTGQRRWKFASWHHQKMGFPGYSAPTDAGVPMQQDGTSRCAPEESGGQYGWNMANTKCFAQCGVDADCPKGTKCYHKVASNDCLVDVWNSLDPVGLLTGQTDIRYSVMPSNKELTATPAQALATTTATPTAKPIATTAAPVDMPTQERKPHTPSAWGVATPAGESTRASSSTLDRSAPSRQPGGESCGPAGRCSPDARCRGICGSTVCDPNTPTSSVQCVCDDGYTGDGNTCQRNPGSTDAGGAATGGAAAPRSTQHTNSQQQQGQGRQQGQNPENSENSTPPEDSGANDSRQPTRIPGGTVGASGATAAGGISAGSNSAGSSGEKDDTTLIAVAVVVVVCLLLAAAGIMMYLKKITTPASQGRNKGSAEYVAPELADLTGHGRLGSLGSMVQSNQSTGPNSVSNPVYHAGAPDGYLEVGVHGGPTRAPAPAHAHAYAREPSPGADRAHHARKNGQQQPPQRHRGPGAQTQRSAFGGPKGNIPFKAPAPAPGRHNPQHRDGSKFTRSSSASRTHTPVHVCIYACVCVYLCVIGG